MPCTAIYINQNGQKINNQTKINTYCDEYRQTGKDRERGEYIYSAQKFKSTEMRVQVVVNVCYIIYITEGSDGRA